MQADIKSYVTTAIKEHLSVAFQTLIYFKSGAEVAKKIIIIELLIVLINK